MTIRSLYQQMDSNKNGSIEKQELIVYLSKDLQLKQIPLADMEMLFDCLDMNKDGILSISELCLCLEGI
jgi:Ca2+-binding EF-hand superfamily protein